MCKASTVGTWNILSLFGQNLNYIFTPWWQWYFTVIHVRSEWFRLLRNGMRAKVCNMLGMVLKKLCSTKLQICYWCEQLRCTLVIVAHLFLVPEAKNNKHIQQKRDIITLHCAFAMVRLDVPCNNLTNPWKLSFPSAWLIQSLRIAWTGMEGPSPSSWNNNLWKA